MIVHLGSYTFPITPNTNLHWPLNFFFANVCALDRTIFMSASETPRSLHSAIAFL